MLSTLRTLQCLLVSTVFGTVSSLHLTSFLHCAGIIRSGGSTGYSAGIVGGVGVVSGSGHGPSSSGRQHTVRLTIIHMYMYICIYMM